MLNYIIERGDYMAQTLVNFRIDEETKKEMEKVCDELGMTVTTALNIFIKKMTREKRIPFDVSLETPNDITLKAIAQADAEEDVYGPFSSVSELMEELNA